MPERLWMVFDVESIGLLGEAYAVAWVVIDDQGKKYASACYASDGSEASGDDDDRRWIRENAPVPQMGYNCRSPRHVREEFWRAWQYAKDRGAILAAECPWPVEATFLLDCIDDDREAREAGAPYPLIDIASVRLGGGLDPLETRERLPAELPIHDPLCDARQSARLLVEVLSAARATEETP